MHPALFSRHLEHAIEVIRGSYFQGLNFYRQCLSRSLRFLEYNRWKWIGRIPEHRNAGKPGQQLLEQFQTLPPRSGAIRLMPVTLPPGRARLATSPLPSGSPEAAITIGMVEVARLAARGPSVPRPTMTSTLMRTSSAATSATARPDFPHSGARR